MNCKEIISIFFLANRESIVDIFGIRSIYSESIPIPKISSFVEEFWNSSRSFWGNFLDFFTFSNYSFREFCSSSREPEYKPFLYINIIFTTEFWYDFHLLIWYKLNCKDTIHIIHSLERERGNFKISLIRNHCEIIFSFFWYNSSKEWLSRSAYEWYDLNFWHTSSFSSFRYTSNNPISVNISSSHRVRFYVIGNIPNSENDFTETICDITSDEMIWSWDVKRNYGKYTDQKISFSFLGSCNSLYCSQKYVFYNF